MKKVTVIMAACAILSAGTTSNAQSLKDILKTAASSVTSETVGNLVSSITTTNSTVTLPGTWKYEGVAVSFESEKALSKVAGAALASEVESKVDKSLQKVGIKKGSTTYTFNSDGTFTSTTKTSLKTVNSNGTYTTSNEGKSITLKYGKVLQYLSMTGTLSSTTKGCAMEFDAAKYFSYIKKIAALGKQSSSSTISTLSSLSENYDGMKVGFELSK